MVASECRRRIIHLHPVCRGILLPAEVVDPARICDLVMSISPCRHFLEMVVVAAVNTAMEEGGGHLVHTYLHHQGQCQARLQVTNTLALTLSRVHVVRSTIFKSMDLCFL